MDFLSSQSSLLALVIIPCLALAYILLSDTQKDWKVVKFLEAQVWVGRGKKEIFSHARTAFRSITKTESLALDGYTKVNDEACDDGITMLMTVAVSKSNTLFILPSTNSAPIVILPPTQIHKLNNLPDSEIDAVEPQIDNLQASYIIRDQRVIRNSYQFGVVKQHLTRSLATMTQDMTDELELATDQNWGFSTEWKSVNVLESCLKIVAQVSNRVFVGTDICMYSAIGTCAALILI